MAWYRETLIAILGGKCIRCGSTRMLELHHIDGDRSNNSVDNIELLCFNCHRFGMPHDDKMIVAVGQVGNSLRISIPKPIVDQLNIKKGDVVYLTIDEEDRIIVERSP